MTEIVNQVPAVVSHKRANVAPFVIPAIVLLGFVLLWVWGVRYFEVPTYVLPSPDQIVMDLYAHFGMYLTQSVSTVTAIIAGFLLAVLIGVPAAAAMVYSPLVNQALYPTLLTAQILPKVAIAPLFIIWFGFGLLPKVMMTFLICFFPIVIDTIIGLQVARPESLLLIRSMGGSRWQAFWKVRMPGALPSMFGGFKVAITFAVVGTLVAEFVGSDSGLGYVLVAARGELNTVAVFSCIAMLVVIGYVLYFAIGLVEHLLVRGRLAERSKEVGGGL